MICCTFAGHRHVPHMAYLSQLNDVIEALLEQNGSDFTFYSGGSGNFDAQCETAVRAAQSRHRDQRIQLKLILPYMSSRLNANKEYYETMYDDVIIPIELAGVHPKAAITRRNRWMVDRSDYVIGCIWREFGGAYETLEYARKQGKTIISLHP